MTVISFFILAALLGSPVSEQSLIAKLKNELSKIETPSVRFVLCGPAESSSATELINKAASSPEKVYVLKVPFLMNGFLELVKAEVQLQQLKARAEGLRSQIQLFEWDPGDEPLRAFGKPSEINLTATKQMHDCLSKGAGALGEGYCNPKDLGSIFLSSLWHEVKLDDKAVSTLQVDLFPSVGSSKLIWKSKDGKNARVRWCLFDQAVEP